VSSRMREPADPAGGTRAAGYLNPSLDASMKAG
jgi:hypothetical protein